MASPSSQRCRSVTLICQRHSWLDRGQSQLKTRLLSCYCPSSKHLSPLVATVSDDYIMASLRSSPTVGLSAYVVTVTVGYIMASSSSKRHLKFYPQFRNAKPNQKKKKKPHVLEPIYIPWTLNTGTCIRQGDPFYSAGLQKNRC